MSVILYSKTLCKPCIETKMYLKQKGIDYIERDGTKPENQAAVLKAVEQTGFRMFPILQIGEQFIVGKNFSRIAELLRI